MLRYLVIANKDYQSSVVVFDDNYNEIFTDDLYEEDLEIFLKIIKSKADALLYRTHERFGSLCDYRIEHPEDIFDGTIYP